MPQEEIIKRLDIHRKELDVMAECVKECQISNAQHEERLKAAENYRKKQNGLLESLNHDIGHVGKKVDALSLNLANRFSELERTTIHREAGRDASIATALALADTKVAKALLDADEKIVEAKEKADADVDKLRVEFLQTRITFNWKIIGAIGSIAFILFIVVLTLALHLYGALPSL
jgi:hypothetical protein